MTLSLGHLFEVGTSFFGGEGWERQTRSCLIVWAAPKAAFLPLPCSHLQPG